MDEVLELRSSLYSINEGTISETLTKNKSISRILIKFDLSEISASIAKGKISNPKYYLKLNTTSATRLKINYSIEARPISEDWDMGSGRKQSYPMITDGASWKYPTSGSYWYMGSGSSWNTSSQYLCSQNFAYELSDISMNVTPIVESWINGTLVNYGFLLKYSSEIESSSVEYGSINFFSSDTHTIYPPTLQIRWDDSNYNTGSMSSVDINSMVVTSNGMKEKYKTSETAKISFFVRDRYPAKVFTTSSRYLSQKYLPSSSYYAVKDAHTEDFVIPFDTGSTLISCNSNSHYFNFDMGGLQPERFYKFVLKIENSDNTVVIDDKFYFKVER